MLNKSFRFMIEYAYFGYYVCFLHVVNCAVIQIYFFFIFPLRLLSVWNMYGSCRYLIVACFAYVVLLFLVPLWNGCDCVSGFGTYR